MRREESLLGHYVSEDGSSVKRVFTSEPWRSSTCERRCRSDAYEMPRCNSSSLEAISPRERREIRDSAESEFKLEEKSEAI